MRSMRLWQQSMVHSLRWYGDRCNNHTLPLCRCKQQAYDASPFDNPAIPYQEVLMAVTCDCAVAGSANWQLRTSQDGVGPLLT